MHFSEDTISGSGGPPTGRWPQCLVLRPPDTSKDFDSQIAYTISNSMFSILIYSTYLRVCVRLRLAVM